MFPSINLFSITNTEIGMGSARFQATRVIDLGEERTATLHQNVEMSRSSQVVWSSFDEIVATAYQNMEDTLTNLRAQVSEGRQKLADRSD